jgi:acyl dehydratase
VTVPAIPILLRAALPSVPGVNLPWVRKDPDADPSVLSAERTVAIDRGHAAAYAEVCGFPPKDAVPLPYPHVLAFPLHLELMARPAFPFPAVGAVHLENTITRQRKVFPGERVTVVARCSSPRPHPKGTLGDFRTEVRSGEEPVWESTSTYLRKSQGEGQSMSGSRLDSVPSGTVEWRLPGDLGRRYAAVSGDRNPIHLYALTAKALGFPRQIAHGMWTKARSIAAIENRLPAAVTVEVAFKKPILLPGTVAFGHQASASGQAFALTSPKDGAPHLVGRTTFA